MTHHDRLRIGVSKRRSGFGVGWSSFASSEPAMIHLRAGHSPGGRLVARPEELHPRPGAADDPAWLVAPVVPRAADREEALGGSDEDAVDEPLAGGDEGHDRGAAIEVSVISRANRAQSRYLVAALAGEPPLDTKPSGWAEVRE